MGIAGEDARFGLAHHLLHARHHRFELVAQTLQYRPSQGVGGRPLFGPGAGLRPSRISLAKRLAWPTTRPVASSNLR